MGVWRIHLVKTKQIFRIRWKRSVQQNKNEENSTVTWCCSCVLISPSWRSFSWEGLLMNARISAWWRTECTESHQTQKYIPKNTAWKHKAGWTHWTPESLRTVFFSRSSIFPHNNTIIIIVTYTIIFFMIVFTNLLLVLRFSFIITVEMSTDLEWSPLKHKQCDHLQQEWPTPRSTNQHTWVIPAPLLCPFPPSVPSKPHSRPLPNSSLIHSNKHSFTSLTLLWYERKLPAYFSLTA